ncbi:MAG: hypothetical protein L0H84_11285 [Pseudonocardia sp.]|nr:hypothetical protein [Pseudonocardia sp.]
MPSQDPSNDADHADALVCRSAAMLLRAGAETGLAGADLTLPLDQLLAAVGNELQTHHGSVPVAVRCAATRLAEHVVRRSAIPVPRGVHEPGERPRTRRRPAGPEIPFTESIRLGRMG